MFYFFFSPAIFVLLRAVVRFFGRVRSSGEENVPHSGPVIYCPNHLSDSDPPTMFVTLPRRAWFVAKDDLRAVPILGWILAHGHVIFIKRDSADRRALRQCEQVLRRGEPLLLFPEGRCAVGETLLHMHSGPAHLALRTGAPIVPVGIQNTNRMLPYKSVWYRFADHPVTVRFGTPIRPQEYSSLSKSLATAALTADLAEALSELACRPIDSSRRHSTQ